MRWTFLKPGRGSRRRRRAPALRRRLDFNGVALGGCDVVASGSGSQRAAGAAIAFAIVVIAPAAARAGAWTQPQGSGLLIETLFGWTGAGAPWATIRR